MDFSFKEKSVIASLVVTLLIFGWYFYYVFSNLTLTANEALSVTDLIGILILIVILEIVIHSFIAKREKNPTEDERDKLIELVSCRNGYWTLCVGIWFLLAHLIIEGSGTWFNFYHNLIFTSPSYLAHLLLLFFVLAEVVCFFTQIYYYRKGIQIV
ncbi:MAG: small-conductance mechanosensitive channel [Pseudohongiellaceae bacterium]|jgi:small-conductance mechanosensitive channel